MTNVRTEDLRKKLPLTFENLPYGSWFLYDEYLYIKVKPFYIDGEEEIYTAIGSDGIAYVFEYENIEPIEDITLVIER